ncbi:MAG TPA: MCP four helix bundle domain-containing protein, partial [Bacteroidota bacterium]|nr:MCP four helix bundle domain-containing protein [Bacteroidota bacterium]
MKWNFRPFKNVKVVLAVGFGLLIILMAISGISIVIIASEVQNGTALIQDNYAQSVRIIGHVQTDVVYLRLLVRDVIFFEDVKQRQTLRNQIDSVMNEIADQFDKTRRIVVQKEEKQSYQAYIGAFDQFADDIHKVVGTVEAGNHEEAVTLYQTAMLQSR